MALLKQMSHRHRHQPWGLHFCSSDSFCFARAAQVGSDNVFKAQMEDIEKAKKEKEAETPEIREMKEKLRQQLAVKAKIIEKADDE